MDIRLLTESGSMGTADCYIGAIFCPDIDYIQCVGERLNKICPMPGIHRAFVGDWETMQAVCGTFCEEALGELPLFIVCGCRPVPDQAAAFLETARLSGLGCNMILSEKSMEEVMNAAGELLGLWRMWQRTFSEAKDGKRLGDIVADGFRLTGCPMALLGKNYSLLAWCGLNGENDPEQEALLVNGHLNEEQFRALKENKEAVVHSVHRGVSVVGSLVLWRPKSLAYLDYCLEPMERAADEAMKRARAYDGGTEDRRLAFERFIYDLLDGRLSDNQEIAQRAGKMGFLGAPYFACMVLKYENEMKRPLNPCIDILRKRLPLADFAIYGRSIVSLIPLKERSLRELDLKGLSRDLAGRGLMGGISGAGMRIGYFRSFYLMALEAMHLGLMDASENTAPFLVERTTLGSLYYFEDYRALYMMDLCRDAFVHRHGHDRLAYLCHPGVIGLAEYDRQHGTNLLPVLYTYLLACRNLAKTGRILNYHRNTILNKIWKIEKLTGLSLDDDRLYPALLLSCMLFYFCGQ